MSDRHSFVKKITLMILKTDSSVFLLTIVCLTMISLHYDNMCSEFSEFDSDNTLY